MTARIVHELNMLLVELLGRDPGQLSPETSLAEDLDIDSTELVEICCRLEHIFGVEIDSAREKTFKCIGDICDFISSEQHAQTQTQTQEMGP